MGGRASRQSALHPLRPRSWARSPKPPACRARATISLGLQGAAAYFIPEQTHDRPDIGSVFQGVRGASGAIRGGSRKTWRGRPGSGDAGPCQSTRCCLGEGRRSHREPPPRAAEQGAKLDASFTPRVSACQHPSCAKRTTRVIGKSGSQAIGELGSQIEISNFEFRVTS